MAEADIAGNTCPLCPSTGPYTHLVGPRSRGYLLCQNCQLIFMARELLPDHASEEARYRAHQNGPQDAGYVRFLNQAIIPALPYLNSSLRGLDFGCGPTPTLSGLLKAQGLFCDNYDPYFFPDLPGNQFDYIFATEVVEHFYNPGQELRQLSALLKQGGILTIMTEPWLTVEGFADWHYAKDITHVCFYHASTLEYICSHYGFEILNKDTPRVTVFRKL